MGAASTKEYQTKQSVINEGATVSQDPRIDSPEIKVTYATEEVVSPPPTTEPIDDIISIPRIVPTPEPPKEEIKEEVKDDHTCSVTVQKAIEQNWIVFAIGTLVLIGVGVAIGKSLSKSVVQ